MDQDPTNAETQIKDQKPLSRTEGCGCGCLVSDQVLPAALIALAAGDTLLNNRDYSMFWAAVIGYSFAKVDLVRTGVNKLFSESNHDPRITSIISWGAELLLMNLIKEAGIRYLETNITFPKEIFALVVTAYIGQKIISSLGRHFYPIN